MSPKIQKANRGSVTVRYPNRRTNAIGEIVGRSSYPYPYFVTNKVVDNVHRYRNCDKKSDRYIDCISAKIDRIEELIKDLSKTVKVTSAISVKNPVFFGLDAVDFSKMETDELISFSTRIGILLFGDNDAPSANKKQKTEVTSTKIKNSMSISNIIDNDPEETNVMMEN